MSRIIAFARQQVGEPYCVYKHTAPNGKAYIGITCERLSKRSGPGGARYKHSVYFFSAITKYGWENIAHEVLFTGLTKHSAELMEIKLIKQYDTTNKQNGYNLMTGGGANGRHSQETLQRMRIAQEGKTMSAEARAKISASLTGHSVSEETRKKIGLLGKGRTPTDITRAKLSAAQKGKTHPAFSVETLAKMSAQKTGKKASEETKAKMSQAQTGRRSSLETRAKLSVARIGTHPTDEARANMSASHKGKPNTYSEKPIAQFKNGQEIARFRSIVSAEQSLGKTRSHISACCRGERKKALGFSWSFA